MAVAVLIQPVELDRGRTPPTAGEFIAVASRMFGVTVEDILGPPRRREVIDARHVTIHAIRRVLGLSWSSIARLFYRDHTAAMGGAARVERSEILRGRSDDLIKAVLMLEAVEPLTTVEVLVEALRVIGTDCRTFRAPSTCINGGRTRGARYGADRWCDGCVARDALERVGIG